MLDKQDRRLSKIKIGLMRNPKFALWSGILMMGKTSLSDEPNITAYTDGRNEVYGREFVAGLNDKELAFVILHENLHKAFRHLVIWRKLDEINRQLANAACDYVINLMLVDSDPVAQFIAMPHKDGEVYGLLDPRFRGMNTKQVFDLLQQEQEAAESSSGSGSGTLIEMDNFDQHGWDEAQQMTEQEAEELAREVDRALRQGMITQQKLHGNGAGAMERDVLQLLKPKVDWREELREFVKSICNNRDTSSWRRVNRRYLSTDTYMPSLIGESIGRIAVGVDTSGSIGNVELSRFLSEVQSIAQDVNPSLIDLIYWDSTVAGHEQYDANDRTNIVSSTKPKGGGGTDPTCMMRYLKQENIKPECIVMLTDGYLDDWGADWEAPTLWVVTQNQRAVSPVGKTIHIEE